MTINDLMIIMIVVHTLALVVPMLFALPSEWPKAARGAKIHRFEVRRTRSDSRKRAA